MRAAQDLDPVYVEDIQNGTLRPGDIDIIDIETHARFETPERVLLADPPDEGGERGIGAA